MHAQLSADIVVSDPEITVLVDGSGNCIEIEVGKLAKNLNQCLKMAVF